MKENDNTDEMLKYLSKKYNKEFSADNFIHGDDTFPELYGTDKIIAHPKDNPEEIFIAYESSKEKNVFYDNYPLAKWAEELKKEYKTPVIEIFSKDVLFKVILNAAYDKYDEKMLSMSAREYLKSNNDVNVTFKVCVKTEEKPEIENYEKQLVQLYDMVKSLNTTEYAISVGFVDSKEDFTDYIKTANVNNTPWSNLNKKVYGFINVDETKYVKSSQDLIKLYKSAGE